MAFYDEWNNVKNYWGVGTFTDDPIVADQTEESKRHWNELRTKLRELDSRGHRGTRNFSGGSVTSGFETWSAGNFTNDPLSESDKLRATHMNELRDKFKDMPSDAHMRGSWFINYEPRQTLSDLPQSSDVTGFWKLEEASGDFQDETGNYPLVVANITYDVTGKVGYGGDWIATDSLARIGAPPALTGLTVSLQSFSISLWIKVASSGLSGYILSGLGSGIVLLYGLNLNAGKVEFRVSAESISSNALSPGIWHLITAVYTYASPNIMEIYVDKVLEATVQTTEVINADTLELRVGVTQIGSTVFPGLIALYDEIAFWKGAALSQADVDKFYFYGINCTEASTSSLQFGDDPVVADQTEIRRCHIMELRGLLKSISDNAQLCTCHSVCSCHGQCCDCDHGSGGM